MARLRAFSGSPWQLPDPELFMLLLTEVPRWEPGGPHALGGPCPHPAHPALTPSYTQRLELLVLQEEFFPRLSALRGSIQTLTDAATGESCHGVWEHCPVPRSPFAPSPELLECEELHTILHLILSTGNHLNSVSWRCGRSPTLRSAGPW